MTVFGLYTYRLDFANDLHIKFITGPNGYGKTTVLSFIDSIIRKDLDIFFQIPFDTVTFCFEENILTVKQIIENTNSNYSIPYDAKQVSPVKLCISFNVNGSQNTETIYVNKGDSLSGNLALFLSSVSCYYIKDQKLSSTKALLPIGKEPGIRDNSLTGNDIVSVNASKFSELLSDARKRFYDGLNISRLKFSETTGRENYTRRRKKIEPEMSFHLMWQLNFLSQISTIVSLRKLQAIIATHSPQIFSQDWSLATDIYEQSQNTDISNEK